MRVFKSTGTDSLLICLILIIGAVLRFYNYADIPFTHDEFSAVFRTRFSNFHDLIVKGVLVDTHPAGVQVFLYYWVKMFGISEPLLKLPFTLFSLASVYLLYAIGRKWFSSTSGLIAASFLTFLQYPVMYGQIARPYASGLFLVLLMVWFWTNLMLFPGKRFYLNLAGYVISSALCAYNHHFTLLFVGVAGLTGVFIIQRKYRLAYILSWVAIFLLYTPHLSIFFSQLKQGGIGGWLSRPRPDFIFDYLAYAFQFSWYVLAMLILLVALAMLWKRKAEPAGLNSISGFMTAQAPKKPVDRRLVLVAFLWFFIPLLAGFLYSFYINPVLQYSVLLFSFPFLLLLMFFYADAGKAWQKAVLVLLTALVVIPSLIFERKHYSVFYKSPYREIITESKLAADQLGRTNCFVLIDSHRRFTDYYLEKPGMKGFNVNYIHDIFDPPVLGSILDTCHSKYFIYGCISNSAWEDYAMIQSKYPYLLKHVPINEGDFYVFSKDSSGSHSEYYLNSVTDFTGNRTGWENFREAAAWYVGDELQTPVYCLDSSLEFSPIFRGDLRSICLQKNDIADLSAEVAAPAGFTEAYLQLGIYKDKELLRFQSTTISGLDQDNFRTFFCSTRLADIDWRHHSLFIKGFIWNPKKQDLMIRSMTFRIRHGNPYLYGLYRKIEKQKGIALPAGMDAGKK